MAILRIVSDNALARAASFAASTTAGTLAAANMLRDVKSAVHRATGTSVTYTATWTNLETLACVVIPFCNLSPTATMRVRIYSDTAGTTQVYDGTALAACPAPAILLRGWSALASSSAYAYGGGAYARAWFTAIGARRLVVDIVDTANLAGYVEASRMVCGAYWSPAMNADVGAQLLFDDRSAHTRSDAGDLLTDIGPRLRKLTFTLSYLPVADRIAAATILRSNGMGNPLLVSLFPQDSDTNLERDYTVYGKLSAMGAFTLTEWPTCSLPIEVEEL